MSFIEDLQKPLTAYIAENGKQLIGLEATVQDVVNPKFKIPVVYATRDQLADNLVPMSPVAALVAVNSAPIGLAERNLVLAALAIPHSMLDLLCLGLLAVASTSLL